MSDAFDIDPDVVCFTFDVEWSSQAVIDDVCALLDARQIRGTFFVTHAGVDVGRHERGIHPNFRRNGETYRALPDAGRRTDAEVFEHVVRRSLSFAPEAKGVRSHSLFFDTALLQIYRDAGIEYDSTLRLELMPHLRPCWKQSGIVEIPTYYTDFFDLATGATGFRSQNLHLDAPGMKVLDFHPNLVYLNASDVPGYERTRPFYHDAAQLLAARLSGFGTRTLFIELLDLVADGDLRVATLGEINEAVRRTSPSW